MERLSNVQVHSGAKRTSVPLSAVPLSERTSVPLSDPNPRGPPSPYPTLLVPLSFMPLGYFFILGFNENKGIRGELRSRTRLSRV